MRNITLILACAFCSAFAQVQILVNVVGYEKSGTKRAVIQSSSAIAESSCELVNQQGSTVSTISLKPQTTVSGWSGRYFKVADFSDFEQDGKYKLKIGSVQSQEFSIGEKILQKETGTFQVSFFKGMRNTSAEDRSVKLYGSQTTHNIYGGWNDATGDRGKHLSHLSYANYFNPQQIPLVAWALLNASELQPSVFGNTATKEEAAWGADYLLRSLSAAGYFYMSVFDNWNQGPTREICAWSESEGIRSADYQSAMREGAGVSIAALARASKMNISGDSSAAAYLAGAKRAYAHLKANPTTYQDNKKENIIDDYCGLLAASELYNATDDEQYLADAQARAQSLLSRQHSDGWFYTENAAHNRPFYHAADEGLPIVALARYVEVTKPSSKKAIQDAIKKNLLWYVNISKDQNPFDYAKMYTIAGTPANPGAVDLARGKTATASRSEANFPPSLAFDGNSQNNSRWSSYENGAENDNQWIAVDLGEVYKVNKVILNWEAACGKDYRIEVSSNNTSWANVQNVVGNSSAGRKEHSITPTDARYVRMFGLTRCIEYGGFSLYDFEVYGEKSDNTPPSPYQARFFMPHVNETGYWWQGENARIASLSAAFTIGAQLADPSGDFWYDTLHTLAITQLDWILGKNPFGVSMMFGFGAVNYPDYPATNPISNIKGGICNGITAKYSNENDLAWNNVDGLEEWQNWRYIEQWLPHNAWYLTAIAALSHRIDNPIVSPPPGEDPDPGDNPGDDPDPGEEPPVAIIGKNFAAKNGAQITVYNLRGQKLLSYNMAAGSDIKMPQGMAKGVYLLNIRDASGKNTILRICAP